jgi:polyisoprenoid-binding protein YceI
MNKWILSALLASALGVCGPGWAGEFQVDTTRLRQVRFISDAPLENFAGVTEKIDGYVMLGSDDVDRADSSAGEYYFEVDLGSLDTGIGLRNSHMRENYLETAKYPYAQLLGQLDPMTRIDDSTFSVTISGQLAIHGVTRPLNSVITVKTAAPGYFVQSRFAVALPDYKIKIPSLMFLKIDEIIKLEVDFYLLPISGSEGRNK